MGAGVNGRHDGEELAVLIERSAELKRDLVDFACSPRPLHLTGRDGGGCRHTMIPKPSVQ